MTVLKQSCFFPLRKESEVTRKIKVSVTSLNTSPLRGRSPCRAGACQLSSLRVERIDLGQIGYIWLIEPTRTKRTPQRLQRLGAPQQPPGQGSRGDHQQKRKPGAAVAGLERHVLSVHAEEAGN